MEGTLKQPTTIRGLKIRSRSKSTKPVQKVVPEKQDSGIAQIFDDLEKEDCRVRQEERDQKEK